MPTSRAVFLTMTILGLALWPFTPQAQAQSRSPLLALSGSWSGQGGIDFSDGHREPVRCRSNYRPNAAGSNLTFELRCASDSYQFQLQGDVAYENGRIAGNWSETSRNVVGEMSGTASPGHINVRAVGQSFAALLNINTRGSSQSVSIQSPGSRVSEVRITMARR